MEKKEVGELRKRLGSPDTSNITKLVGYYVNGEKKIVSKFSKTFGNLDEAEQLKYLELAKKCLGGKINNNLLNLSRSKDAETAVPQDLLDLVKDGLKDDEKVQAYVDKLLEKHALDSNVLILFYHDIYDVPKKGKDAKKQGESDVVYSYVLTAICPVESCKRELECEGTAIELKTTPMRVKAPTMGFLYPAFNDRCADDYSILFYSKDSKELPEDLIMGLLECNVVPTNDKLREKFANVVIHNLKKTMNAEETLLLVYKALAESLDGGDKDLTPEVLSNILDEAIDDPNVVNDIVAAYKKDFKDVTVCLSNLVEKTFLKKYANELERITLKKRVAELLRKIHDVAGGSKVSEEETDEDEDDLDDDDDEEDDDE